MSGIQQMLTGGTYKPAGPTTIGQAWGGGFYAGKISTTANGVATHYLIVAPKATGEAFGKKWGVYGVTTTATSVINGPTNTTTLVALGADYQAAVFCNDLNSGGGLNGYTDWYMPARNELEVLYYFLKPTTTANNINNGSNANAVSPEPIRQNYTSSSPAQTSAGIGFRTGETNAFVSNWYWASTQHSDTHARQIEFTNGDQREANKNNTGYYVRAVRRIPV
jgi:hypothetical protein